MIWGFPKTVYLDPYIIWPQLHFDNWRQTSEKVTYKPGLDFLLDQASTFVQIIIGLP